MTVLANHTMATAIIHLIVFHIIHGLLGSSDSLWCSFYIYLLHIWYKVSNKLLDFSYLSQIRCYSWQHLQISDPLLQLLSSSLLLSVPLRGTATPMEGRHSSALLSLVSHQVSSAHPLLSALQIATYVWVLLLSVLQFNYSEHVVKG